MMRTENSLFLLLFIFIINSAEAACTPGTPCYQLCPEVSDENSYNNAGRSLRYLFNGKKTWIFATDLDLREDFTFNPDAMAGMKKLKRIFDHYGTRVVIAFIPTRGLVHSDKLDLPSFPSAKATKSYLQAAEQLRSLGYIVPDFSSVIPDKSGLFYQKRDHHWNTDGSRKSARIVADAIKNIPDYKTLKKQEFVTDRVGIRGNYGTLASVGKRICDAHYPTQYFDLYTTLEKNGTSDDSSMFGDSSTGAEVILLGTSMSKGKIDYNFAGFMEEYLSVAIDNKAIRGGGYNASLDQIIVDGVFKKNPPKLLIWELPAQYAMDSPEFYRLISPALSGGCNGPGLISEKMPINDTEKDIIYNGTNGNVLPISAKDHMLKLKFSDPTVFSFFINLTYLSGEHEKMKVERQPYVKHDGTFYFELPDSGKFANDTLFSIGLRLPQPTEKQINVEAQVCKRNVI